MQQAGLEFRICSLGPGFRNLAGLNHIVGLITKAETLLGVKNSPTLKRSPQCFEIPGEFEATLSKENKCSHFYPKMPLLYLL